MPLDHSHSKSSFTNNVKTLMNDVGKSPHVQSRKQALAVAYATEREPKGRAFGGVAPQIGNMTNPGGMMSQAMNSTMPMAPNNAQASGIAPPPMMDPSANMNAGSPGLAGSRGFAFGGGVAPAIKTFKGPIVSSVPGRTDKHFTHVPSGSFVIPADIVSGHGEGNTLAGMHALEKLFKLGSQTSNSSRISGNNSTIKKLAKGGGADQHVGKPVEVVLAGGEIVVPPENVHETMERIAKKKLTLSQAHQIMDKWVLAQRKKLVKTLKKLPPPAKD